MVFVLVRKKDTVNFFNPFAQHLLPEIGAAVYYQPLPFVFKHDGGTQAFVFCIF